MTDALTAAPDGPQTDTLAEQVEIPKPQDNLIPEEQPEGKPKPKVEKSTEEKRSDTVKKAIDKALDEPKTEEKPETEPEAPAKPQKAPVAAEDAPQQPKPEPKPTAYKEPPSGFDDAAKAEWEAVPESVRGAMHRRAQEMERGIHKYRQEAEQFEPLRQYADMAKQSGTDLPTALGKYVAMETALRQDPISGLQAVVANLGLRKPDGQPVTLRDIAARIMGQPADQNASRQEATIGRLTQQVQALTQQLGGFSQHVEQQKVQARTQSAEAEWTAFQQANPRAKELEPQIAEFLTKYPADSTPARERLQDAYDWAIARNPSVAHTDAPPLVQTQTPPAPNPAGQKSISGAPGTNAKTAARKLNRSDAVAKAIRAAGL